MQCPSCNTRYEEGNNYCRHCNRPLSFIPERIEYYKSKNEKRKCDLERDNACLNNQLIGIITIFGSATILFLYLLNKDNLIFIFLKGNFSNWFILFCYVTLILSYVLISLFLFFYYKRKIYRKVSNRADHLNEYFESDIIRIGEMALISDNELTEYRRTKR